MAISQEEQTKIQKFCNFEPRTISSIAKKLKLTSKNAILQLRNFFSTTKAKSLFYIEKINSIIYIRTNPLFFSKNPLDLILTKQNESNTKTDNGKPSKNLHLNRASPERFKAAHKLNRINKFGFYNRLSNKFEYTHLDIKNEIDELFHQYCNRVQHEKIVLSRSPSGSKTMAKDEFLTYKTRFTSAVRQKENIENFRYAYSLASSRHIKGVFLTLTSNPKGSLWEINQNTRKAWVTFRSKFLEKQLPAYADWIKVSEFQKNGMLHYHVLIFGINWLALKKVIQYAWVHAGGGPILDIHSIQNTKNGWVWCRSKPSDAKHDAPEGLLQKYLEKSMSKKSGALYWVMGIRTWTCSKSLRPPKPSEAPQPEKKRYTLKGVLSSITGFRFAKTKASLKFFTPTATKPTIHKPKDPTPPPEKPGLSFKTANQITQSYLNSTRN